MVSYEPPSRPATSTSMTSQFGVRNGRRVLLLEAVGLERTDDFELTRSTAGGWRARGREEASAARGAR